jgi:hypothetical protein
MCWWCEALDIQCNSVVLIWADVLVVRGIGYSVQQRCLNRLLQEQDVFICTACLTCLRLTGASRVASPGGLRAVAGLRCPDVRRNCSFQATQRSVSEAQKLQHQLSVNIRPRIRRYWVWFISLRGDGNWMMGWFMGEWLETVWREGVVAESRTVLVGAEQNHDSPLHIRCQVIIYSA